MADTELNNSLCQLNWLLARGGSQDTSSSSSNSSAPSTPSIPPPVPSTPTPTRTAPPPDKPPYSYAQLIRMAIENTPEKKCNLSGIYSYIEDNFPFYRKNNSLSWKNSIRHNLSLNRQFRRLEKQDGEKGASWVISTSEEIIKRKRKGSPTRINPIVEKMYLKNRSLVRPAHVPNENSGLQVMKKVINDRSVDPATISLYNTGPSCSPLSERRLSDTQLPEDDLGDLVLFASHDMSASFKQVYDQVFHQKKPNDKNEEDAQIDWLKIGLEAAGVDYNNDDELKQLDADRFSHFLRNRAKNEAPKVLPSDIDDFSCPSSLTRRDSFSSEDDDFDWSSIL